MPLPCGHPGDVEPCGWCDDLKRLARAEQSRALLREHLEAVDHDLRQLGVLTPNDGLPVHRLLSIRKLAEARDAAREREGVLAATVDQTTAALKGADEVAGKAVEERDAADVAAKLYLRALRALWVAADEVTRGVLRLRAEAPDTPLEVRATPEEARLILALVERPPRPGLGSTIPQPVDEAKP